MINVDGACIPADQKNVISTINSEIEKQPTWKRWKGFSYFKKSFNNKMTNYDLVLLTHAGILCVDFLNANGKIVLNNKGNWCLDKNVVLLSPLINGKDKVDALRTEITQNINNLSNPNFPPKVINLVVITGDAELSDLKHLPFSERILSLHDFLGLINNDRAFNDIVRPHPKGKKLHCDFDVLTELLKRNAEQVSQFVEDYQPNELLMMNQKRLYSIYTAESLVNDCAVIKQWNFAALNIFSNPNNSKSIINNGIFTLNTIKKKNPQLYQKCLPSLNIDIQDRVDQYYDEIIELPDQDHISLKSYLQASVQGLVSQKLDMIQSMIYTVSELHKLKIAHGDLNPFSIWVDGNNKIKLSQFTSAYNLDFNVVDKVRAVLPLFSQNVFNGFDLTPYQKDVYWVACLAWHIAENIEVAQTSLRSFSVLENDGHWFTQLLFQASKFVYMDATEFLEAFLNVRPTGNICYKIKTEILLPYFKDNALSQNAFSNNDIAIEELPAELSSYECLRYKAKLDKLDILKGQSASEKGYIPEIIDYGITQQEDEKLVFYVITKPTIAKSWSSTRLSFLKYACKKQLAINFIESLQHYHHLQYGYGELSGETIDVDLDNLTIKLSKALEYEPTSKGPLDPSNCDVEMPTIQQRDNYAALKMLEGLFRRECKMPDYAWLVEAFKTEFQQNGAKYLDLTRFLDTLLLEGQEGQVPELIIRKPSNSDWPENDSDDLDHFNGILPDNGKIYVQIKQQPEQDIEIELWGVGGKVSLIYTGPRDKKLFVRYISPKDFISKGFIDDAVLELNIRIKIEVETGFYRSKQEKLTDFLSKDVEFNNALELFCQTKPDDQESMRNLQTYSTEKLDHKTITTKILWGLIKDTEEEALPIIEMTEALKPIRSNHYNNYFKAKYDLVENSDALDRFNKKDKVHALLVTESKEGDFTTRPIGEVDMIKSTRGVLYIKNCKLTWLNEGTHITLQSSAEQSSNRKRKIAIDNILKNRAVIPNLIDYFEKDSFTPVIDYGIHVSEAELDYYKSTKNGKTIDLNSTQREAFKHIMRYGPVSVLQGPPGTGKTEFISAFVHYLFHRQGTKNILVVSQSHEAVNTTVERIRQRFDNNEQNLSIVRISNKAELVSKELLDIYSGSIIESQKAFFKETLAHRILTLGAHFNFDQNYLRELIQLKVEIFEEIKQTRTLIDESDDTAILSSADFKIFALHKLEYLKSLYDLEFQHIELSVTSEEFWKEIEVAILAYLDDEYKIEPAVSAKVHSMIRIAKDCEILIDAPHANYERFLAQTRQLVCGTCVGIGNNSVDITNQIFDFVIIDEAARSSSSELAIAMQAGKRILLVGDHKQLPPLYANEHSTLLKKKLNIGNRNDLEDVLKSDFEHVFNSPYGKQVSAQLLKQYRMAPGIGHMVSNCFYDGQLQTAVYELPFDNVNEKKRPVPPIYNFCKVRELKAAVTWVDTGGNGAFHQKVSDEETSIYNSHEINEILSFLHRIDKDKTLLQHLANIIKVEEAAIGIICAYAEQKRRLAKGFISGNFSALLQKLVKIDTVDSYQGKENRIVIFSVTRNTPNFTSAFLGSQNRVNVALSRSMDRLVIFGSTAMWKNEKNSTSPLYKVLTYIEQHLNQPQYQVINRRKYMYQKRQGVK